MDSSNKTISRTLQFALALALIAVALPFASKQPRAAQNQDNQFPPLIRSLSGSDLFQAYCASCHGLDARGTGPIAPVLRTKVPDLTLLTRNYHGQFPTAYVRQVILGDSVLQAHGTREMPIWGPIFHQIEYDQDLGNVRLDNLVKYLESIQEK